MRRRLSSTPGKPMKGDPASQMSQHHWSPAALRDSCVGGVTGHPNKGGAALNRNSAEANWENCLTQSIRGLKSNGLLLPQDEQRLPVSACLGRSDAEELLKTAGTEPSPAPPGPTGPAVAGRCPCGWLTSLQPGQFLICPVLHLLQAWHRVRCGGGPLS